MPTLALQIISFVQLALKAAPAAKELYDEAKLTFEELFKAKLITKEEQSALMTWADAHQAAVLAGQVPPELTVES